MKSLRVPLWTTFILLSCILSASAADHGIMIRVAHIYLNPDETSTRIADITRGREVAILDRTPNWLHVLASITPERDVTGWILDKGAVTASTPNGDQVLFGAASDSEHEASRRGGRNGAAQDAMRMYARTQEYFPNSPLAGEALYRAADIRWQLDVEDYRSRPSAKDRDPTLVPDIPEDAMRQVMKKFAHTKWSELAAFHLLQNKIVRRLAGIAGMSGERNPGLPEVRQRSSRLACLFRSYVRRRVSPGCLGRVIQNQQCRAEIDRRRNCERQAICAARHRQESTERLGVSRADSDIHGGSENARVWKRGSVIAFCGCPISPSSGEVGTRKSWRTFDRLPARTSAGHY